MTSIVDDASTALSNVYSTASDQCFCTRYKAVGIMPIVIELTLQLLALLLVVGALTSPITLQVLSHFACGLRISGLAD